MPLSRAEKSRLSDWWFSVDHVLLAALLAIAGAGLVLSFAATPGLALKRGLPAFYHPEPPLPFWPPAMPLLPPSPLPPLESVPPLALTPLLAALALMLSLAVSGVEIKGARRWVKLAGYSLQPSEFAK